MQADSLAIKFYATVDQWSRDESFSIDNLEVAYISNEPVGNSLSTNADAELTAYREGSTNSTDISGFAALASTNGQPDDE